METLIKLNQQLMNAPVGVIVALFAIALGYVLKSAAFFNNKFIPLVIVSFTAVMFPLVQFCVEWSGGNSKAGYSVPMNVMLGFVIGFLAWLFHAQILKRWVDPRFFPEDKQPPEPPKQP